MENMYYSSTHKLLRLLCLLLKKDYTKNEITNDFKKFNIDLKKTTINQYIEKLSNNSFEIEILKEKNENLYHLKKDCENLNFTFKEMEIIKDIKKLLIAQKNYNHIRKIMRLFYKFAIHIQNQELKEEFIDFGYYSTLNWSLIQKLEKHCANKDLIEIDYILPQGENKLIKIYVDNLKISDWSERLYLHGIFLNANQFSQLPVDRIFSIKKVIKQNAKFEIPTNFVEYKVSTEILKEIQLDSKEEIISQDKNYTLIKRPIDDNFYLIQRLLYFCPDLFYISNENIKHLVKEKLRLLKLSYDDSNN